jgi:hypothetical protein
MEVICDRVMGTEANRIAAIEESVGTLSALLRLTPKN